MSSLTALQNQLAALQSQAVKPAILEPAVQQPLQNISASSQMVTLSTDDLQRMVKDAVATAIAEVRTLPQENNMKELSLLEAVGLCLTEEEQVWLSDPVKLKGLDRHIPRFIQTEEGKLFVQTFMKYYRGVYES